MHKLGVQITTGPTIQFHFDSWVTVKQDHGIYTYTHSTSQMFGHTVSFNGFIIINYFLHCRLTLKTSKL